MSLTVDVECPLDRTLRVQQVEAMYDLQPQDTSTARWSVDADLSARPWQVGLIVGPSGAGKSTITGRLFPDVEVVDGVADARAWPPDKSILDGFAREVSVRDITRGLAAVGFSSVPAWLRPYRVLSTGERFRATVARALVEAPADGLVVIDEFTSVVDRQVAQVASAAIARAVRRTDRRLVAVTCHHDVLEWLQPDWVLEPGGANAAGSEGAGVALSWRSVQRRPTIDLEIRSCHRSVWELFSRHHYLSSQIPPSSWCFVAFYRGEPVAIVVAGVMPGRVTHYRIRRTVCLPDYQGVGIGTALADHVASVLAGNDQGRPVSRVLSNPAMMYHCARSPHWLMTRAPGLARDTRHGNRKGRGPKSTKRATAAFRWVGPRGTPARLREALARAGGLAAR